MRFLTAVLCVFFAPLAGAGELLKVYDQAVANDTQLQAAAAQRDAASSGRTAAFGALLPQVNGSASLGKTRQTVDGVESDLEPQTLQVSLNQAIFNKQLWDSWQQAGDRASAAEINFRATQQNLALRVAEAYFNLLAAADGVRLSKAETKSIERQLDLANKRFEVGLSAITDVQEAQARYDLTVATGIQAEQALSNARAALGEITGYSYSSTAALKEDIPLLGPNPNDINEWVRTATEGNLTLLAAKSQADIARNGIDISQDGHLPTVSLIGSYTDQKTSFAGFPEQEIDDTSATLRLDVPIFAGFSTQANVNAARATYAQRKAEQEGTRRQVERITRDAYQGVIAGIARVKAFRQAVLSNTTALEAAEVGLEVGTRTAVDVLNAQRELFSAQRDHARARYDYLVNVLRLKNAAGQLAQKDLVEIDGLLVN